MSRHGYVALVCRISEDRSGRVEGVRNQERWGRTYAGQTWPGVPVVVFADNDISATDGSLRPEYERFREAVRRGEVAHVWAAEQSRLERDEGPWFALAAELAAAGISELHTRREGVVRVGEEIAGIRAVLNAAEVRKLKARVRDRLERNAEQGIPSTRPFGYRAGVDATGAKTLHMVEAEAAIIREAADRFLSGWSLAHIAADLRDRGVEGTYRVKVTASGRRWTRARDDVDPALTHDGSAVDDGGVALTRAGRITSNTVRSWLTSASIAGRRVHNGVDLGPGNWPAIVDADTFAAVRERLAAPVRTVATIRGTTVDVPGRRAMPARRYLLTGFVVCGVCGAALIGTLKQRRKGGRLLATVPYYACHPKSGGRGCVGVLAEPLDELIASTLLAELDRPAFRAAWDSDEHGAARAAVMADLAGIERQRSELAREWAGGGLSADEWRAAREGLSGREQGLRRELAELPAPVGRVDLDGLREAWGAMTLDERREVLGMFVGGIGVGRARPGLHTFDAARVADVDTWWRRPR